MIIKTALAGASDCKLNLEFCGTGVVSSASFIGQMLGKLWTKEGGCVWLWMWFVLFFYLLVLHFNIVNSSGWINI